MDPLIISRQKRNVITSKMMILQNEANRYEYESVVKLPNTPLRFIHIIKFDNAEPIINILRHDTFPAKAA